MQAFPNHKAIDLLVYGVQMENENLQNVWKNIQLENYAVL